MPKNKGGFSMKKQEIERLDMLRKQGKNGGPRCCKRDSYLAIIEAVKFTSEKLHIDMKLNSVICTRSHLNNQCRQEKCPFHKNYTEY